MQLLFKFDASLGEKDVVGYSSVEGYFDLQGNPVPDSESRGWSADPGVTNEDILEFLKSMRATS